MVSHVPPPSTNEQLSMENMLKSLTLVRPLCNMLNTNTNAHTTKSNHEIDLIGFFTCFVHKLFASNQHIKCIYRLIDKMVRGRPEKASNQNENHTIARFVVPRISNKRNAGAAKSKIYVAYCSICVIVIELFVCANY